MTQAAVAGEGSAYAIWGAVLALAGVLLILLEIFIPSGGLIAVIAATALVGSIVAFFMYDTTFGFAALMTYIVLTPIVVGFGFRLWVNSSLGRRMILRHDVRSGPGRDMPPMSTEDLSLVALVGRAGRAETALRPVGVVRIEDQRVDAIAETGLIDAGIEVVVTDVYNNQVRVRPRT